MKMVPCGKNKGRHVDGYRWIFYLILFPKLMIDFLVKIYQAKTSVFFLIQLGSNEYLRNFQNVSLRTFLNR